MNDLLLFVNSFTTMKRIKNDIQAKWEMTDMSKLSKIVGIEITLSKGRISITQTQNIINKQSLNNTSPVQMPLDPNVKLSRTLMETPVIVQIFFHSSWVNYNTLQFPRDPIFFFFLDPFPCTSGYRTLCSTTSHYYLLCVIIYIWLL